MTLITRGSVTRNGGARGLYLEALGPQPARVTKQGGSQLRDFRLWLVFSDSEAVQAGYAPWHLYNLLSRLAGPSDFSARLGQYGAGPGRYAGYQTVNVPAGPMTPEELDDRLAGLPDAAGWGPSDLVMVYLGPETQLEGAGVQYCAYHTQGAGGFPYGVHPFPSQPGCTLFGRLSPLSALTMVSAHELAEAMTDAVPGQGVTGSEGEIDDFAPCLWQPVAYQVDGWTYQIQAFWDELAGRCFQPGTSA